MSKIPTYFMVRCLVCGRTLQIPVHLLGELLSCEHCRATFLAQDRAGQETSTQADEEEIMHRTDLILSVVRNQRARKADVENTYDESWDGGNRHDRAVISLITDKGRYTRHWKLGS